MADLVLGGSKMASHGQWPGGDDWKAGHTGAPSLATWSLQQGGQTSYMVATHGSKRQKVVPEIVFKD